MGHAEPELRLARVSEVRAAGVDVRAFDLVPADGRPFPAFRAGAHVQVHVPGGLVRAYSLCGRPDAAAYTIAVKREPASRGGSAAMHDTVSQGDCLALSEPRGHFALADGGRAGILIAGGIGITPLLAMARELGAQGRPWELHYCARSEAHAAFLPELRSLPGGRLHTWLSATPLLDVRALLAAPRAETDIYCCGPGALMSAVAAAAAAWPADRVHFEHFAAPPGEAGEARPFEVVLARSGKTVAVAAHQSILEAVRAAGVSVSSACEEGVCGTCETTVIDGVPDHRDALLTPAERQQARTMMICVSRAQGSRLVLDL